MTVSSRVFAFALATGIAASVLILFVSTGSPVQRLTTWQGLAEFGGLLIIAVFPLSLPMLLVGAWSAARIVSRQSTRRPLRFWLVRSTTAGFLLAALGAVIWYGGMNAAYLWRATWDAAPPGVIGPGRSGTLSFMLFMMSVSGLAGGSVGALVGLFCWYATRRRPPNNALQELAKRGLDLEEVFRESAFFIESGFATDPRWWTDRRRATVTAG